MTASSCKPLAFTPAPWPTLPIAGNELRFPVGRIFCVGRNYAAHAREMGADPTREPPFFFTKAPAALVADGAGVPYPPLTNNLHHEVELVIAICEGGANIASNHASRHVFGHAVGIDFTRRDRQDEAKGLRRPWDLTKSFDGAAPVGAIRRGQGPLPAETTIMLAVNGTERQRGILGEMIWNEGELIAELSRWQPLAPGDLIFTGTPAGVGAGIPGDAFRATIAGIPPLEFAIGTRG